MKVLLTVIEGPQAGTVFEFDRHDTFIVGRAKAAQFRLSEDDEFFSRNHFLVEVNPPLCRIMDLNSTNGTRVNGRKIQAANLQHGDIIRGGKTKLRVSIGTDDNQPEQQQRPSAHVSDATIVPLNRPRTEKDPKRENTDATLEPLKSDVKSGESTFIAHRADPDFGPSASSPSSASLPSFPGYKTLGTIGRGGMGVVYEAESSVDRSHVAIKVVLPDSTATEKDISRFLREAEILKDLNHPNIVRFRELNQSDGSLFIVMDFVAGKNAEQVMKASKERLPVSLLIKWVIQLLDALHYAHERGYIHRDVKPTNLLVDLKSQTDTVYLADFGLSRAYQSSKLSGLTMTGDIAGSTPFMPPEQITNYRNVEPFADQYSAGATLYYLLTGKHVYDIPREIPKQLLMILQDPIVPILSRRSDLPPSLVEIIERSLARNPSARFPSAAVFRDALQDVLRKLPAT